VLFWSRRPRSTLVLWLCMIHPSGADPNLPIKRNVRTVRGGSGLSAAEPPRQTLAAGPAGLGRSSPHKGRPGASRAACAVNCRVPCVRMDVKIVCERTGPYSEITTVTLSDVPRAPSATMNFQSQGAILGRLARDREQSHR
jgi:hypothetical protein